MQREPPLGPAGIGGFFGDPNPCPRVKGPLSIESSERASGTRVSLRPLRGARQTTGSERGPGHPMHGPPFHCPCLLPIALSGMPCIHVLLLEPWHDE